MIDDFHKAVAQLEALAAKDEMVGAAIEALDDWLYRHEDRLYSLGIWAARELGALAPQIPSPTEKALLLLMQGDSAWRSSPSRASAGDSVRKEDISHLKQKLIEAIAARPLEERNWLKVAGLKPFNPSKPVAIDNVNYIRYDLMFPGVPSSLTFSRASYNAKSATVSLPLGRDYEDGSEFFVPLDSFTQRAIAIGSDPTSRNKSLVIPWSKTLLCRGYSIVLVGIDELSSAKNVFVQESRCKGRL